MFRWRQINSFSKEEIFERFRAREHQEGIFDEESAKCICLSEFMVEDEQKFIKL